jgi:hypothetical protein
MLGPASEIPSQVSPSSSSEETREIANLIGVGSEAMLTQQTD